MQKFDPFPDTRIGPRVAGLRPPGYRKQMSEPARSRQQAKQLAAGIARNLIFFEYASMLTNMSISYSTLADAKSAEK